MFHGMIDNGILLEVRDLKTKEGSVWRTVAKIAFTGGIIEAIADGMSGLPAAGSNVKASGLWTSSRSGQMDFKLESIEVSK